MSNYNLEKPFLVGYLCTARGYHRSGRLNRRDRRPRGTTTILTTSHSMIRHTTNNVVQRSFDAGRNTACKLRHVFGQSIENSFRFSAYVSKLMKERRLKSKLMREWVESASRLLEVLNIGSLIF
jgi:hypothetical protein